MAFQAPYMASFLFLGFIFALELSTTQKALTIQVPRFPQEPGAERFISRRPLKSKAREDDDQRPPQRFFLHETHFFTQTLDHFDFRNDSFLTFQQRYLLNRQYWTGPNNAGPIFVYCGGNSDIIWQADNAGFLLETAPQVGALLVFMEHRYYGRSLPDMAFNVKNADTLGYLTSEQALADYVALITDLKKNLSAELSPVVAFGGSYGGMLAAWLRLKYPHVVYGAVSSSAPILQFDYMVPSDSFYRIATQDFQRASLNCYDTIKESWDALNASIHTNGIERVAGLLRFCRNADLSHSSIMDFFETTWINLAMADYPYPSDYIMPLPGNPVVEACKAIDATTNDTDILIKILAGANVLWNSTNDVECFETNSYPHGEDLWGWQTCTEMVMPLDSSPANSMFPPSPFNVKERISSCMRRYGATPRPHWIDLEYGGHDLKMALENYGSNIIFSNGLRDPWSGGGVLENISRSIVALVTEEGAHNLDFRPSTVYDPAWLIDQRKMEVRHLRSWMREYYKLRKLPAVF